MPFLKGRGILESRCRNLENLSKKNGLRHSVYTPAKDRYIGEWKDNIKGGKGVLLTRTSKLYEGDWDRNYRHNFGVLSEIGKGDVFNLQYRGDWKNGRMHGFGVRHYPDGSYYKGNWKCGKRDGYGQMWYADGSFYDGDWCKDRREGDGMFVRPDGNRYEGKWLKDQKSGKGRFFHLDSGQMQDGVWSRNICTYSTLIDIPFRQTAVTATQHPVLPSGLEEPDSICKRREDETLIGKMYSRVSLRIWV